MLIFTSLAAYFTYFIHGIGASILGQYKPEFAAAWGAKPLADGTLDVSMVVSVIAALGLGRLISLPFSGPLSDKYGRKLSGIIGVLCYVAYFFGMANSTSMAMGYAFAVIGGIANSFLDTCVSPTCMEIYVNNPSVANLFTKFSICLSQFLLPFLIGIVASANMSYKTIFIVAGIAILIDGILILILPFPAREKAVQAKADKKKSGHKISPAAIAAILIGFTSSSTFMLWLNCNQELARSYGMADPSKIQSLYALGTATAILATAAFIKKGLKEGIALGIGYGVFAGLILIFFGRPLSMIFVSKDAAGSVYLSGRWFCDRICRCRRCSPAGSFHNSRVLPREQRNSNLTGNDRIQHRELHNLKPCRVHYQSWRKQCSENDPSSEHGSDHRRYPARPLCKEEQKSVRQCANKLIS